MKSSKKSPASSGYIKTAATKNSAAPPPFPPASTLLPASNPKTSLSHPTPPSPSAFTSPNPPKLPIKSAPFSSTSTAADSSSKPPLPPVYHSFLNLIAAESNAVILSVDYRTAPDHPVPACFHDSWEAIRWAALHGSGSGPDPWVNEYADLANVFFAGDSAGANIAHHMAIRVGSENPGGGVNLQGVVLLHPYFWGKDRVGSESDDNPWTSSIADLWKFAHPGTSGVDDPLINPDMDPKVSDIGCSKILVYVGEKDILKDRGWYYKGILGRNGWRGDIEVIEDKGVDHVYFLFSPYVDSACTLRTKICAFINNQA
ncbi:hypothetical protein SSX86_012523 [Deinandra increscens subsp. villosa]|uniref:Alpha/beta hydrolase fold-3 domain-containing protein n=1 Tax=Deinandra increscens subsp. villosa TaxID=3103831 RepID=A0AAP0D4E2_9ASTR